MSAVNYLLAANDSDLLGLSTNDFQASSHLQSRQAAINFRANVLDSNHTLNEFIDLTLVNENRRLLNQEITLQTFAMLKCRFNGHLRTFLGHHNLLDISSRKISDFIIYLQDYGVGAVTINQYLGLLKRVLLLGLAEGVLDGLPSFPKVKSKSIPRGSFSTLEYLNLLRVAKSLSSIQEPIKHPTHRNTAGGAFTKTASVPQEMRWLIAFMVNTFVRPVDIKLIKNMHIQAIEGSNKYLRISMMETKRHTGTVISMRAAVGIYRKILAHQTSKGFGRPNDYVFLPEVRDRQGAIQLISHHFKKILDAGGMAIAVNNEKRSLYSLRHTAITFRLLYGKGIDLITLARNARTSVEMIERFYSSKLTAEMNVEMLQSKRTSSNIGP